MSKNLKGKIQFGHMGAEGKIILQHILYKSAMKMLMVTTGHFRDVDNESSCHKQVGKIISCSSAEEVFHIKS